MCSTAQYSTLQGCTVQHSTAQHSTHFPAHTHIHSSTLLDIEATHTHHSRASLLLLLLLLPPCQFATEAALTILRIDDLIKLDPPQEADQEE